MDAGSVDCLVVEAKRKGHVDISHTNCWLGGSIGSMLGTRRACTPPK